MQSHHELDLQDSEIESKCLLTEAAAEVGEVGGVEAVIEGGEGAVPQEQQGS